VGAPRLSEARSKNHGQDRADELVDSKWEKPGTNGDLGEGNKEDPEAHTRDGSVDDSLRIRRAVLQSIRRGVAGYQPDSRKCSEDAHPDQPAWTFTQSNAHQHGQSCGADRRDRCNQAHTPPGEAAEQKDAAGRRTGSGQKRPGEVLCDRAAREDHTRHEHDERPGGLPDQNDLP